MLVAGHSWATGWSHEWSVPTKAALFQARKRLGSEPLRALYDKAVMPLADPQVAGDFYRSWRLMSIDGLCLDVADTEANVERFGRPASSRGDGRGGAFPQVRVVGLAECGSHAIIDAAVGAYRQGEQTLVEPVLRSLLPDMLLLADRGFFSYTLWDKARSTGADLLWRIKSTAVLPVEKRYSDGSFGSHIYPGTKARRNKTDGIEVRVVEYTLEPGETDADAPARTYRLMTTITDPERGTGRRTRAALHAAMGNRDRLRRAEDPSTQPGAGTAIEDARRRDPGGLRLPVRALRDPMADAFGGNRLRARPGQAVVHPIPAGRSAKHLEPPGFFPLTSSVPRTKASPPRSFTNCSPRAAARTNPRVVKRKMSGYQLNHNDDRNAPTIDRRTQ